MKLRNINKVLFAVMGITMLAACKKDSENIFNMFDDVTVTFNNNSPLAVTDYKLVNDGDSVYVDYTINSAAEDMYTVTVEKISGAQGGSPERIGTSITDASKRRSYSNVLKLKMNRDGKTSYRIYALNQKGTYIGDGYKKVTIEVNPSYMVYANRRIYLPDTVGKVLPAFFSLSDATAYSYTDGKANSAKIDFGIYRKPNPDANDAKTNPWAYYLFSISAPTNPLTVYDVSTWEKRATKFAAPQTSQTNPFLYNAVSASTIVALAKARNPNLTATTATNFGTGLAPGNSVAFLTPEGKYGIMFINAVTSDYDKRPFIDVSVKIQR
jgi:hypothetical protein